MDGLMLDTEGPVIDLWVEVARKAGFAIDRQVILDTTGLDRAATKAAIMEACGKDFPYDTLRAELVRIVRERGERDGIPHRPGLCVLLDRLGALKLPLAVATSTDRAAAEWKLKKAGILDRFAALTCGDEVERGKPAPDIFLLAAKKIRLPPEACVGFEDSPAGLTGLHAAGIRSVFIKDTVEPDPALLAAVWRRCTDLAEAAALFPAVS